MNDLNNFNEVKDPTLRAYNRLAVAFNILNDVGSVESQEYLSQFSKVDIASIAAVATEMKRVGLEQFKKNFISTLTPEDDDLG